MPDVKPKNVKCKGFNCGIVEQFTLNYLFYLFRRLSKSVAVKFKGFNY